jgi:hypothetical protein
MHGANSVVWALVLIAIASSSALAEPKQERRILVASYPPAELRVNGELICTTPCVVPETHLKGTFTLSNEGFPDLTYRYPLPPTPPGGVLDPAQEVNFEIGRDFMMFQRSPGLGNDNMPPSPPVYLPGPPQPIRQVPSPKF